MVSSSTTRTGRRRRRRPRPRYSSGAAGCAKRGRGRRRPQPRGGAASRPVPPPGWGGERRRPERGPKQRRVVAIHRLDGAAAEEGLEARRRGRGRQRRGDGALLGLVASWRHPSRRAGWRPPRRSATRLGGGGAGASRRYGTLVSRLGGYGRELEAGAHPKLDPW